MHRSVHHIPEDGLAVEAVVAREGNHRAEGNPDGVEILSGGRNPDLTSPAAVVVIVINVVVVVVLVVVVVVVVGLFISKSIHNTK